MPKYTLTYFDMEGAGEKIRLAFLYAGVPLEDKRVSHAEFFGGIKAKTPVGQVPVIQIDDGPYIGQSDRIVRDISTANGLIPADAKTRSDAEGIIGLAGDIQRALTLPLYLGYSAANMGHGDKSPEEIAALQKTLREALVKDGSQLLVYFGELDKELKANGTGFAAGDKPSIADAYLLPVLRNFTNGALDPVPTTVLDKYEGIQKFLKTQYAIPAIKAHYKL